jgi:hypothetical protein
MGLQDLGSLLLVVWHDDQGRALFLHDPMRTFDPDVPSTVHDRLNDRSFLWHTGWARAYRQYATAAPDDVVWFEGLILDGWELPRRTR